MVISWYLEWLQGSLNVLIGILRWYGLVENIAKSKAMKFQTRTLLSGMLKEVVVLRCMDRGVS